jgi:uncharacterized protein
MFKIKKLAFAIAALTTLFIAACKTKAPEKTATAAIGTAEKSDNAKSLLWEISGKDLKKPSYLYGTIHIIPKADYFITEATQKAFDASEKVTFEINMKEMNNPMALMGIMGKAMMADGKKLKDLIKEEDYKLVQRKFDTLGLPLKMLERMKPMFLSVMMGTDGEKISLENNSANKSTSYEMEFMQMGEKQKKDFDGLETIEFQMGIFDSIPYKVQAEMLVKTIKSGGSGDADLKKMVEMYKKQDIDAMSKMLASGEESDLAGYEKMLVLNRNRNWIPLMAKSMRDKTTFFAVGAGHLGGNFGVVNLLRKEGYKLKALN